MESFVIKIHPAVVHMFDGDFDGDTMHCAIPITKEAINDLPSMDVIQYICKHPKEFNPGKEIGKYHEGPWPTDPLMLRYEIESIRRKATNGMSISWKDLTDRSYPGYFNGTKVDRNKLAYFSKGITEEEVSGEKEPGDPQIGGVSIADAVRDYRIIKTLVPRFGGLSNSLMALAIGRLKKKIDEGDEDALNMVKQIAHIKHILCQDGLSAKHGTNKVTNSDKLHRAFYRPEEDATEEDYRKCMEEFGLPKEGIDAIMDIFWTEKPMNINDILKVVTPHYTATRRGASLDSMEDILEHGNDEESLQKQFLDDIIETQEVTHVNEHPVESGGRKHPVSRKQAGDGLSGGTHVRVSAPEQEGRSLHKAPPPPRRR